MTAPVSPDTIFAPASGAGRAAITVLRLSGPGCADALRQIAGRLPRPRFATLCRLRDAADQILDRALVLWFPGPDSATGEDAAELHLHGSRAVLAAVSARLLEIGVRLAQPGEFTRRAFLNHRMDLLEAEGLADLIDAETEAQRRQAQQQMDGALSRLYTGWGHQLRRLLAHQEALIDFPDEGLPASVEAALVEETAALLHDMRGHLADAHRGERVRDGVIIAVTGPPNVGKSSLVNALAARDVAIVSSLPGTTRDVIEVRLDLNGVPVTLIDTAGLRETADPVEAEGVRRARARAAQADIVLQVIDATAPPRAQDRVANGATVLVLANKVDLAPSPAGTLPVSAMTGQGLDRLHARLVAEIAQRLDGAGPPLTRARHRAAVAVAVQALAAAQQAALPELRAEDLRHAMAALGQVTGHVGVEDVLDTVFSSFCIGK